jgi:HK97 family phage prohead protease
MNYKTIGIQYKDEGNGSIEGYASTWVKEPDSYGDICREGCFKNSLENRWNGGKNIPLLWAHKMDDLDAYVGTATAQEDETGLFFHADFNGSPEAEKIRGLYKNKTLTSFSFAYDVIDEGTVTLEDGRKANELRELDIFEISCVLVPANGTATVTDVKAGRRNSKSDEDKIKQAIALLQSVLDTEEPDDGEDDVKANAAAKEPDRSNPEKENLLQYIKSMEG